MMLRKAVLSLLLFPLFSHAQDIDYVRSIIDSLCAPRYHGRGYVSQGDVQAADFIGREIRAIRSDAQVEFQPFELAVNTFPGEASLQLDKTPLVTGRDFIVEPNSKASHGTFEAIHFKPKWAKSREKLFKQINKGIFKGKYVVLDTETDDAKFMSFLADIPSNPLKAEGYILIMDGKLTWAVGREELSCTILQVKRNSDYKKIKSVTVKLDQEFIPRYEGKNVVVTLPGTDEHRTDIVVFTAHLDHLGRMGSEVYIPGASDNASGCAMLLDLYKYYEQNRPAHALKFIWFGGEEAGLVGSFHFVEHPLFSLEDISFLLNLDLMGDGKTGITVVNGKVFSDHFAKLVSLNAELGLLEKVKSRGAAANSDHYPFSEKGVPAFFIYTTGDYKHYHDIDDRPENLPLAEYENVFRLLVEFVANGI